MGFAAYAIHVPIALMAFCFESTPIRCCASPLYRTGTTSVKEPSLRCIALFQLISNMQVATSLVVCWHWPARVPLGSLPTLQVFPI
jgi:hypothetical protein